jgi:hypothetical protein
VTLAELVRHVGERELVPVLNGVHDGEYVLPRNRDNDGMDAYSLDAHTFVMVESEYGAGTCSQLDAPTYWIGDRT